MIVMKNKLRIAFIGCVESSFLALDSLIKMDFVEICAVVTRKDSKVNSDFVDLSGLCDKNAIPYHFENPKERDSTLDFLKKYELDVIYCFGWSYLLKKEILELAPNGVIGFHPAKLPANRGRHPIIWALVLGLKETASTFFKMDEGADSGPILSQKTVMIEYNDNATSLYKKILLSADQQIKEFTLALYKQEATFKSQDDNLANYWRKRGRVDGLIDWRMNASSIHNLIRALTTPYPGAEFKVGEDLFTVMNSSVKLNAYPENIEPGKILSVSDCNLLVKCAGTDAIWLHDLDSRLFSMIGEYL